MRCKSYFYYLLILFSGFSKLFVKRLNISFESLGESQRKFENLRKRYGKKRTLWKKLPKSDSRVSDVKRAEEIRKAYEFLAWLDQLMALRTTKGNLDNEENENLSFHHQQEDESDEEETEGEEKGDQSESEDDTTNLQKIF